MSESIPCVTVFVLSYQHKDFIERSLTSVVYQSFRDFEVIYIDNNSPDGSYEKGLALLKNSRVTFCAEKMKENIGAVRAANYALKKYARGKYMTPLSGDDWWDMENLEHKVQFMEQNPQYGMVYGNGYSYDEDTTEIKLIYQQPSVSGWILKDLLKGPNINPEGIMYQNALLEELDYYDENARVEDKELWTRVARRTQIGYLHKPLTFYRVNHSGNVSRNLEHMREGNEYLFKKYEKEFPHEIRVARIRLDLFCAYSLAIQKPSWHSLKYMLKYYHFNWSYNKQILKCMLNMLRLR